MKLDCFIVCDDIRAELGNKFSLMGIYLDRIVFQRPKGTPEIWPKAIKLGFYLRFLAEKKDEAIESGITFNFYCENNGQLQRLGSGVIDNPKALLGTGKFAINMMISSLIINKQGTLNFYIDFLDNKNKVILEKLKIGTIDILDIEVDN